MTQFRLRRPAAIALLSFAATAVVSSCTENLPSGPEQFIAQVKIVVPHDSLVVGDSSTAQAQAIDEAGYAVSGLTFNWTSADNSVLGFATPASGSADATSGRTNIFVGKKPGQSVVTLSLPDPRFATTNVTRTQTVVVAGIRVLSTRDSTLTAVNDTAYAIATSLVHQNGASVNRASQGIHWIHLGTHTAIVGQGDTIRYIARSNGADTLIATIDFCLRGAKCADTVVARVSQSLSMSVSTHSFQSWSFADSLAPIVKIADRRGTGLAGTSVRLIPLTAADSTILKVSAVVGTSDPSTGTVATPRLVTIGNGTATAVVLGLAPDGFTAIGRDTITVTVRQVARRVAVEPLRARLSVVDSLPYRAVARDAHGAIISDATTTVSASGTALHGGIWVGPNPNNTPSSVATITPTLSGIALPENNPDAPQIAVLVDQSLINLVAPDTVIAGNTTIVVSTSVLDSLAQPAINKTVKFGVSGGGTPAPVLTGINGVASVTWTPPDIAGSYTLTGVLDTPTGLATLEDSTGRIVIRRSIVVIAAAPDPNHSSVGITANPIATNGTATVSIAVRDIFGNLVKNATPAAFNVGVSGVAGGGTIGAFTCVNGICTATYTAPGTAGQASISVQINGVEVSNSPITLTIQ